MVVVAGLSEVTFTTNAPPTSGSLSVTPPVGVSLLTPFALTAFNWVDDAEDLPLLYRYPQTTHHHPSYLQHTAAHQHHQHHDDHSRHHQHGRHPSCCWMCLPVCVTAVSFFWAPPSARAGSSESSLVQSTVISVWPTVYLPQVPTHYLPTTPTYVRSHIIEAIIH